MTTDWGTIKIDSASYSTPVARIFAGGDCVSGPATVIEALNMGNKAAKSIDAYLQGKTFTDELSFAGMDTMQQKDVGFVPKAPTNAVEFLDVAERVKGYAEVEGGFSAAEAIKEAQRCPAVLPVLSCGNRR